MGYLEDLEKGIDNLDADNSRLYDEVERLENLIIKLESENRDLRKEVKSLRDFLNKVYWEANAHMADATLLLKQIGEER